MSGKAVEAWNAYGSYNNLLRAWFVAFGIGVPATFLVNPNLAQHITLPEGDPKIFTAFLVGAGAQVFMAFINKVINWCQYYTDSQVTGDSTGFWVWLPGKLSLAKNWFVIDFLFDAITIYFFSQGIIKLFLRITDPADS